MLQKKWNDGEIMLFLSQLLLRNAALLHYKFTLEADKTGIHLKP